MQGSTDRRRLLELARAAAAFEGTPAQRRAACPELAASHPRLLAIIDSGRADLRHLEFILSQLDAIDAGSATVEQASKEVADRLNAQYIEAVLPPLDPDAPPPPPGGPKVTVVHEPAPLAAPIAFPGKVHEPAPAPKRRRR